MEYLKHPKLPPPVTLEQFNNKPSTKIPDYDEESSLQESEVLEDMLDAEQNSVHIS